MVPLIPFLLEKAQHIPFFIRVLYIYIMLKNNIIIFFKSFLKIYISNVHAIRKYHIHGHLVVAFWKVIADTFKIRIPYFQYKC
jgi:hypothetical protein